MNPRRTTIACLGLVLADLQVACREDAPAAPSAVVAETHSTYQVTYEAFVAEHAATINGDIPATEIASAYAHLRNRHASLVGPQDRVLSVSSAGGDTLEFRVTRDPPGEVFKGLLVRVARDGDSWTVRAHTPWIIEAS